MCMPLAKVLVCIILRVGGIQHTSYNNTWMYKRVLPNDSFDLQNTHIMGWYSFT